MQFTISIIGAQNTGKSAFIAAILGETFSTDTDSFDDGVTHNFDTTKGTVTFTMFEKCLSKPFQYILGDAKILDDWQPSNAMEAQLLAEFDSLSGDDAKTEIVSF